MPDATKVSAAKAKVGGSIHRALLSATELTIPTSVSATLGTAFKDLGYISEDGVTNSNSPETDDIKAWGGDTVLALQTAKPDTFKFKLIESLNSNVLETVYGASNVTTDSSTNEIKVVANANDQEDAAWVIDMVMKGNKARRIVIPNAKITSISDIVYADGSAVGYEITLTAVPDTAGNTHYEYIL